MRSRSGFIVSGLGALARKEPALSATLASVGITRIELQELLNMHLRPLTDAWIDEGRAILIGNSAIASNQRETMGS
jgi:hypothetical protein